jgi:maltose alpha-D-glucosyltransferase/alpha-amylase
VVNEQYSAGEALGQGDLRFLEPENRAVLAYVRAYQGETIPVIHNLAPQAQAVELDLGLSCGQAVDLLTGERWSPPPQAPCLVEMGRYGYRWLRLEER